VRGAIFETVRFWGKHEGAVAAMGSRHPDRRRRREAAKHACRENRNRVNELSRYLDRVEVSVTSASPKPHAGH